MRQQIRLRSGELRQAFAAPHQKRTTLLEEKSQMFERNSKVGSIPEKQGDVNCQQD